MGCHGAPFWSHLPPVGGRSTPNLHTVVSGLRDFANIFESMEGLPPRRAVDFHIDLVPSASPASRPSSRMSVPKQIELKCQLKDLESKQFIWTNSSLWGAVKKENGYLRYESITRN